ncbi:MAG: hypothetical protein ABIR96_02780 [Bdellovibrionota bacterium]
MKALIASAVFLISLSATARDKAHAVAAPNGAKVFAAYLAGESQIEAKSYKSGDALKRQTMELLGDVVVKIEKAPADPLTVSDWNLKFALPKLQSSSDLWVSLSESKYEQSKLQLRANYDERRKGLKDAALESLYSAFSLAQAVLASSFRDDFLEFYTKHYVELDMSSFQKVSQAE